MKKLNKKGYMDFEVILAFLFIIGCVVVGLFFFFASSIGASHGKHTGTVTAIEYNSNIIWGANIVYFKSDAQSSQEDQYCVNDAGVKAQLEEFAKKKATVTISYDNPFITWRSNCNGGASIIVGVN